METPTSCPKCECADIYTDGTLWICPICAHEWTPGAVASAPSEDVSGVVRDAHGNELKDGDSVTVIKDLKVKGASSSIKVGTKVKNIQIVDASDGHNISCRVDGFGAMHLKSEFVKKAT